ncbi:MAG: potassium channel family protein [Candidatus Thorarchaeota archaeon]
MVKNKKTFEKIVEKLVELKDTSEMMLDLAYSSLLLNSKSLAEEVQFLEEHMDDLHTELELLVLSSGFNSKESKDFLGLIRLGLFTETIADAAAQIAELVLRGIEPHPVLKMAIEEADKSVVRVTVPKKSKLIGQTIKKANIPEETGMWILAIRRGNRWIRPRPRVVIEAKDTLIASGYADGEKDFIKLIKD